MRKAARSTPAKRGTAASALTASSTSATALPSPTATSTTAVDETSLLDAADLQYDDVVDVAQPKTAAIKSNKASKTAANKPTVVNARELRIDTYVHRPSDYEVARKLPVVRLCTGAEVSQCELQLEWLTTVRGEHVNVRLQVPYNSVDSLSLVALQRSAGRGWLTIVLKDDGVQHVPTCYVGVQPDVGRWTKYTATTLQYATATRQLLYMAPASIVADDNVDSDNSQSDSAVQTLQVLSLPPSRIIAVEVSSHKSAQKAIEMYLSTLNETVSADDIYAPAALTLSSTAPDATDAVFSDAVLNQLPAASLGVPQSSSSAAAATNAAADDDEVIDLTDNTTSDSAASATPTASSSKRRRTSSSTRPLSDDCSKPFNPHEKHCQYCNEHYLAGIDGDWPCECKESVVTAPVSGRKAAPKVGNRQFESFMKAMGGGKRGGGLLDAMLGGG